MQHRDICTCLWPSLYLKGEILFLDEAFDLLCVAPCPVIKCTHPVGHWKGERRTGQLPASHVTHDPGLLGPQGVGLGPNPNPGELDRHASPPGPWAAGAPHTRPRPEASWAPVPGGHCPTAHSENTDPWECCAQPVAGAPQVLKEHPRRDVNRKATSVRMGPGPVSAMSFHRGARLSFLFP